ncbi:MAG: sulfurtransferase [Alphaproteobacteria bacterium]|nr:sulfurtransferase [Alphaproteobacteria bacterium]
MRRLLALVALCLAVSLPAMAQPLVSAEWLSRHLTDSDIRVIDVGRSAGEFLSAHIPGSAFTDYKKDGWRVERNGVPDVMNTVPALESLLGRLGVSHETHVILVAQGTSAYDMASATRLYWTLKMLGHEGVSILDGGLSGYAQKKLPLEAGPPKRIEAVAFAARPSTGLSALLDEVATGSTLLVDSRPSDEYLGINKSDKVQRYGTLPGAINLPLVWMTVDGKGFFRKPEELKALFAFAKVPASGRQIVFCNTGHTASLVWFVAHELLGNSLARLYDGSLAEWSLDPGRPMKQIVVISM